MQECDKQTMRLRKLPAVMAIMVACLAALSPLAAFEPVRSEPDLSGFRKLGALYWKPALFLRNAGYEDNIFLAPDERAVSDLTATVSPEAEFVAMFGERGILRARPSLGYTFFSEHSGQNFLSTGTSARADLFLNRWSFYADAGYLSTRVRPNDEVDLRPRRVSRHLTLGSRFENSQRVALDLFVLEDDTEFKDDDPTRTFNFRERLTHTERAAGAALAYRVGRRADLIVEAESRDYDFTQGAVLTPRARARRFVWGLDWEPADSVRLRLRAGNLRFSARDLPDQAFDGLVGSAGVRLRLWRRVLLEISGNRDLFLSSFADNLFGLQNRGSLRLFTLMTRKLGAEFGGELSRVRYSDQAQQPVPRVDRFTRVYLGALYRLSDHTVASMRLTRFERQSNVDVQDRELTTLSATLGYFF